jgi:predicted nuclease with RNAse H fold
MAQLPTDKKTWLGIDFSGNHRMWRTKNKSSNIYIAEVTLREGQLSLDKLRTVQELPGEGEPFQRLVNLLKSRHFNAAAIDAPFSVPCEYLPEGGHKTLLENVAKLKLPEGWPFPGAQDFACHVLSGRGLTNKKPLRKTEQNWSKKKINVRSTLWAGPRGGAAMTAACLSLLYKAGCPIWPWDRADQTGLLVEAFPAAQLCEWELNYERYNDKTDHMNRKMLVISLSKWIEISDDHREQMEESADALDAVVCAFAAIAVSTGTVGRAALAPVDQEGLIAVHEGLPKPLRT